MKTTNIKLIIVFSVLFNLFLTACSKSESKQDTEGPEITIYQPSIEDNYLNGDTLRVLAAISDNDELHDISANIVRVNKGVSEEVWVLESHSHLETYDLFGWYVIEVEDEYNEFELSISASDHNGNVSTKKFEFQVIQ